MDLDQGAPCVGAASDPPFRLAETDVLVRQAVAAAPPLTPDQRARLQALLASAERSMPDEDSSGRTTCRRRLS